MAGFLVVNPRAGDAEPRPEQLRDEAERRGLDMHLLSAGEDPAEVARAAPAEPLGMAGGDGSLAAVAEVALEQEVPFVVVPFGTRTTSRGTSGSIATIRSRPWTPSPAGRRGSMSDA